MPRVYIVVLVVLGCGDSTESPSPSSTGGTTPVDDSSGSVGGTSRGTDEDGTASRTSSTSSSSSDGSSSGAGYVDPVCGDQRVGGDEECDDANDDPDDGCDNDCNLSGVVEWTLTRDGPLGQDDSVVGIAVAPDGTLVVAGVAPDGVGDVTVRRYSPTGDDLDSFAPETSPVAVEALAVGPAGEIYLATSGLTGASVARYDAAGVEAWRYTRVVGGRVAGSGASTVAAAAAGVVAGGLDVISGEGSDAWLVRLDPDDGTPVWEQIVAGEDGQNAETLAVAIGPAGVVAAGVEVVGASFDGWVRSFGTDGVASWEAALRAAGPTDNDVVRDVELDPDGRVYATGGTTVDGAQRMWTGAYEVDGTLWWERTYGGPDGSPGGFDIALTPDSDVVVAGSIFAVGEAENIIVRRYSGDGQLEQWTSRSDGGAGNDAGRAIAVAADGSIYAGGEVFFVGNGSDWWIRRFRRSR